ncbi:NUDIX hydrolase, partial [Croceibacter atlanticus]
YRIELYHLKNLEKMPKQEISITTDAVIFSTLSNTDYVLLIQRKNDPFKDEWALPGGFLETDETFETGAKRELKEETGLDVKALKQIGVFGAIGRDPRGRTISIAFVGTISSTPKVEAADDAKNAKWWPLNNLPNLAFDHSEIIAKALKAL